MPFGEPGDSRVTTLGPLNSKKPGYDIELPFGLVSDIKGLRWPLGGVGSSRKALRTQVDETESFSTRCGKGAGLYVSFFLGG
jgi:hypothetical protein